MLEQESIVRQKEIDALTQTVQELEYAKKEYAFKEKKKLLAKQNTMVEVIHKKDQQLFEQNKLLEEYKNQNRVKERVLITFKEQL